jgi:hypothetical protein
MHVWAQRKKMTCLTIWPPEWLFCFQEGLGCMELACICCLEYCVYHHLTPAVQRYALQNLSFFSNCVQIFGQYLKIFNDFRSSLLFLSLEVWNLCALFLWCFAVLCDFHYSFPHFCVLCQPVLSFIWTKFCAISFMRSTYIYGKCDGIWYILNICSMNGIIRALFFFVHCHAQKFTCLPVLSHLTVKRST